MYEPLKLMAVTAHPDDESLGLGGVIARYAEEGIETFLVVATRGERGWQGPPEEAPSLSELGEIREAELRKAADILGLEEVNFLGYLDGELDQADPARIIGKIAAHIRRIRPQVVVTFPPDGSYGHPDHIAISQFCMGAIVRAARPSSDGAGDSYPVKKFYYTVWDREIVDQYEAIFGTFGFEVDGVVRKSVPWEPWAVTTRIDTEACWEKVMQAVACHRSQLGSVSGILSLDSEEHRKLWGRYDFIRAFSLVNGGRRVEDDLFAGLR